MELLEAGKAELDLEADSESKAANLELEELEESWVLDLEAEG
jgi:hypothetical protein